MSVIPEADEIASSASGKRDRPALEGPYNGHPCDRWYEWKLDLASCEADGKAASNSPHPSRFPASMSHRTANPT